MNTEIFRYLNNLTLTNPWLGKVAIFLASPLACLLILIAIIFLFFHLSSSPKQKVKEILFVFVTALAAWLVATVLKNLIHSPRPFVFLPNVNLLVKPDDVFSFPSGHATFFGALATALYFYHKRIGLLFFLGAVLIGLGRIMSGIHFPIDILAGLIIGWGVALAVYFWLRPIGKRLLA